MPSHRAISYALSFLLVCISCRPDAKNPNADTASSTQLPASVNPALPVNTGWDEDEAGPVMLLASPDNSTIASVVIPALTDSAFAQASRLNADSLMGMSFDLVARNGMAGTGRLEGRAEATTLECLSWPSVNLKLDSQRVWEIGFRRGVITALPLDSLEGFSSSDSSFVTTELARLASALPAAIDPAFQGLPFAVRKAYRSSVARSSFIIADIVRKINEEANPREEHLLLIAERSEGDTSRYRTVFESRAAGPEDLVRTSDILAAVRFVNGGRAAVIVAFEYENGSRVVLIERNAPYSWRQIWRSAYAGC